MGVYHELIDLPATQSVRLLRWDENFSEIDSWLAPGQRQRVPGVGRRWHGHPATELTYIEAGIGTRFVGDHMGAVDPPELVLLGANLPHHWSGLDASSGAALQFDLAADRGVGALPEVSALDSLWQSAAWGVLFKGPVALQFGQRIKQLAELEQLARIGELLRLLADLTDAVPREGRLLSENPFALSATTPHSEAIAHAITFLTENFAKELSVEDVSEVVGLSRATLCRYFRRYTGRSIVAFLNRLRIDRARRMLIQTSLPISQIALTVGYGNLSHFNRQFRCQIGESPTTQRKAARRNKLMLASDE